MNGAQDAYAQLLGVGVVWMAFHCVGMCGPLVVGLRLGGVGGGARGAWAGVLAYQAGKAITYAALGALAGAGGAVVRHVFKVSAPALGMAMALVMVVAWWRGRTPVPSVLVPGSGRGMAQRLIRALSSASVSLAQGTGMLRAFKLGVVLGLLPCGVVAWALMLAAGTGTPLHGAAVMVLLAALTVTPLLVAATLPTMRMGGGRWARVASAAPLLSATWMVLVSAASWGWLDHAFWQWSWGSRTYTIMFW